MDNPADCIAQYLPIKETGYFSALVKDYLAAAPSLKPFYTFTPDDQGLAEAVSLRQQFPVDRSVLVSVLQEQYSTIEAADIVRQNIASLQQENTFTICTAHQPNLMTGYLYFIYKIIHAAKLAQHLKTKHPDQNFVPVFYIGSEDNDLDELGVFRYNHNTYRWNTPQTGAVGSMHTDDLQPLIKELFQVLGPVGVPEQQIKHIIGTAYSSGHTIAQATRIMVNELLGFLGVVVLDANDYRFKKAFIPVIENEMFQHSAQAIVTETSDHLNAVYAAQAFVRPINFFYMKDNIRERIEQVGEQWQVLNTDFLFDAAAMRAEINNHPERFSPNVILRGLYQETILPNVAFIGGGSEVAYWMQLRALFHHYQVFFPAIVLRQSALIIERKSIELQQKLQISLSELFQKTEVLINQYVQQYGDDTWQVNDLKAQLEQLEMATKADLSGLDHQLHHSAEAVFTKMKKQVLVLEKKILKAVKRKMDDKVQQIRSLKEHTFPNDSLQERYDTFLPFYLTYGQRFFEDLYAHTHPYGTEFLVLQYQ
ncbi:bacillithiol biosynthesis cysteine-adding enzyme BshC [Taibaiella sp. KBW10]|uniref:bacillithiol biosynthesis cysteine-adding enzyme BshC n=1 Tax=Taibaiella sp. KBW10 TaxID=2153357 RepID=UPI000F59A208|nr:bacillithiol biosynthesis cysteine-adding enzyme BshC [Taibaiella sp. KBW10]RQO31035.1 bacillithiol biosynthesis cysteine-adding enzyme BshC [Taibaiella sp. KBW10]